jgi:hypothetical protein
MSDTADNAAAMESGIRGSLGSRKCDRHLDRTRVGST